MYDILSVFSVLHPHLSMTSLRQFSRVVLGIACDDGACVMLNLSRWTSEGEVTAQSNASSTPLSLGGVFTGCFLGRICWIVKAPISSLATKPWSQNQSIDLRLIAFFLVCVWQNDTGFSVL